MDEELRQAEFAYERWVFGDDPSAVSDARRGLDALEAGTALARGRLLHAQFLADQAGSTPSTDQDGSAELALFERAAGLYRSLDDPRGEAEATFWIGCFHQVVRHDRETAVAALGRADELARQAGDQRTLSYVLRHLGIAEHQAGRLGPAAELLEKSTALRRGLGFDAGVAANLIGLAYLAAGEGRSAAALDLLSEADVLAQSCGAQAICRQVALAHEQLSG